jgi:hypothetical protein
MKRVWMVVVIAAAALWACGDDGAGRDDDDGSGASSSSTAASGAGAGQPCEQIADKVCTRACACTESPCSVEYQPNGAYAPGNYEDCYSYFEALYCNSTEPPWVDVDADECLGLTLACSTLGVLLPNECGGGAG